MSDIFTPLSWSILRLLDEEQTPVKGYYLFSGNIYGRCYTNLSYGLSVATAFGISMKYVLSQVSNVFGNIPEGITIPIYPFSVYELLKSSIKQIGHRLKMLIEATKSIKEHIETNTEFFINMKKKILKLIFFFRPILYLINHGCFGRKDLIK